MNNGIRTWKSRRWIALLLTAFMLLGMFPTSTLALGETQEQVHVLIKNDTYTVAAGAPWEGTLVDAWVTLEDSSTMMSCVVSALTAKGYTQTGAESNYISEINGLEAMAGGFSSGWMGTLNDWITNEGFGAFTVANGKLESGDEICIQYTMAFGEDLGGTFGNNDKTVKALSFSTGTLDQAFSAGTHSYTLTVPAGTTELTVTPTAANKNFQVRTTVNGTEYKRTASIPVSHGTVITVKCGEVGWPTCNNQAGGTSDSVPGETYTVTVAEEGAGTQNTPPYWGMDGFNTGTQSMQQGDTCSLYLEYELWFTDDEEDTLSYYVSVDGAAAVPATTDADGYYNYTPETAGTHTLYFTAHDGALFSQDGYTLTLTVIDPNQGKTVGLRFSTARLPAEYTFEVNDQNGQKLSLGEMTAVNAAWNERKVESIKNGVYTLTAKNGGTFAGSCMFEVTDSTQTVLFTGFALASNDGFVAGTDYTAAAKQKNNVALKNTPAILNGACTFLAVNGVQLTITVTPSAERAAEGFTPSDKSINPYVFSAQYTAECAFSAPGSTGTDTITVPTGASVWVGVAPQGKWYLPFTQVSAVGDVASAGGADTYSYDFESGTRYCYRVSAPGKLTVTNYVDRGTEGTHTVVIQSQMAGDPAQILRDDGYYGSGVLTNADKSGVVSLQAGQTFSIHALRNWQIVNDQTSNYTVDPPFHYTVLFGADVVSVDAQGVITAKQNGEAILAITYDAIRAFGHTYGATLPEDTGVIVVKVGEENTPKLSVDHEFDVMYYTAEQGGYDYTFNAIAGGHITAGLVYDGSFSGFSDNAVTQAQGRVTVKLTAGKNIIRIEDNGQVSYQVITAKQVTVSLFNVTKNAVVSSAAPADPGDQIKATIQGLSAPLGKLACLYNFQNNLKYTGQDGAHIGAGWTPLTWGGASYDFSTNRNSVTFTIPADWDGTVYSLTGTVAASGYGSVAGAHRSINRTTGASANTTAVSRSFDYSVLPQIAVPVYQNGAPTRKPTVPASKSVSISEGGTFSLDLSEIFEDPEGDALSYLVGVDQAGAVAADASYTFRPAAAGTYTLVFAANDGTSDGTETYTVVLSVIGKSTIYTSTGAFLYQNTPNPGVASTGGDWAVLGLARSGYGVSDTYHTQYVAKVVDTVVSKNGVLHAKKYTEYSRVVLGLTAVGYDVTNVGGYNLLEPLADFDMVCWQGINGPVWALIALDSHAYSIPAAPEGKTQTTREKLIASILNAEIVGGGWALWGTSVDPDITGMAIQALAPYYSGDPAVKAAVDRALEKLSALQNAAGGFGSVDGACAESSAQVLVALTALGIDPAQDSRFVKNGNTVLDSLHSFYVAGGGFRHILSGSLDGMATEQSYYALAAYHRFLAGQTSLYDMRDVAITSAAESAAQLIRAIGSVHAGSGSAIHAARAAYDALTDSQKKMVDNLAVLTAAEAAYGAITARIDSVKGSIARIGTVEYSATSRAKITAARQAYDGLSADEKQYVDNRALLLGAEARYQQLENAQTVLELIAAIGTVTKDSKQAVQAARAGYDTLSAAEKALVSNYTVLTAAERRLNALNTQGTTNVMGSGSTKVELNGVTYLVDAGPAALMQETARLTEMGTPDVQTLIKAYQAYQAMSDGEKAQVFNYDDLKALFNQAGANNHKDSATGAEVEGVAWYVSLRVEETVEPQVTDILENSIGSNQIIRIWNISLTDLLENRDYQSNGTVRIKIPAFDLSEYDQIRIAHYKEDGTIEYLDCKVENGYILWEAESFSPFALIGGTDQTLTDLVDEPENAGEAAGTAGVARAPFWLGLLIGVLATAGVAVIVTGILMKTKGKNSRKQH